MRKQYHFRPSDLGLPAWDVDKLVALARVRPVEDLPLASIAEVDENWWFAHGEVPTVRRVLEHLRLMEEVDLSFPVIVDPDGRLMDGMHRVAKALSLGRDSIEAHRLPTLPPPDFVGVDPSALPYD